MPVIGQRGTRRANCCSAQPAVWALAYPVSRDLDEEEGLASFSTLPFGDERLVPVAGPQPNDVFDKPGRDASAEAGGCRWRDLAGALASLDQVEKQTCWDHRHRHTLACRSNQ